ncbi:MAG: MazG nucleotide pyrophosphohydrolase domain-containing protein [candidate division WOR-3 bacterium]
MKKIDFKDIYKIVEVLRKKCPWDKVQTLNSMKKELLEEVYEIHDAINKKDYEKIKEEIGDAILSLFLMIKIGDEKGYFKKEKLLKDLKEKIIRKHPHVFKNVKFKNKREFLKYWESEKKEEDLNITMPSLLLCEKILKRMKRLGKKINKKDIEKKIFEIIRKKKFNKESLSALLFYSSILLTLKGYSPEEILKEKFLSLK